MEHRVLSPTAILGYGFPERSFQNGIDCHPDVIAVDAGSTDPGPYYLGAGKPFTTRDAVMRDLSYMLQAAVGQEVPLVIGSAGGSGAKEHVDWTLGIVSEIASRLHLRFRMGVIYADIPCQEVSKFLEQGRIRPLQSVPDLTLARISETTRIVAQFGVEPIQEALSLGCEVIVCGRCYDPAPFAAAAVAAGFDPGPALHMGKILECGAIAATPGSGADCVLGTLCEDGFILEALDPGRRFTSVSTAAHSLYEKSNPYVLPGPGGALDLHDVRFVPLDRGRVRVSGSRFVPELRPTVKLEGARQVGYRTICIAGIRDPILIAQLGDVLANLKRDLLAASSGDSCDKVMFRVYGRDGVMGLLEPVKDSSAHELGLVIEAIGRTQEQADSLCARARTTLLHLGYPKRMSTAGNLAFPFSPSDVPCGAVYEFSVYHLLEVDDPVAMFPVQLREV